MWTVAALVDELSVAEVTGHPCDTLGHSLGLLHVQLSEHSHDGRVTTFGLFTEQPWLQVFVIVVFKSEKDGCLIMFSDKISSLSLMI